MTPERKAELQEVLNRCDGVITMFYATCNRGDDEAIRNQFHAFCEWAGVMREHLKICEDALAQGIDFLDHNIHSGKALFVNKFRLDYLNEKMGCIFTDTLQVVRVAQLVEEA